MLDGIIFGMKTSKDDKAEIKEWIIERDDPVNPGISEKY
jgi:hypothetical protein